MTSLNDYKYDELEEYDEDEMQVEEDVEIDEDLLIYDKCKKCGVGLCKDEICRVKEEDKAVDENVYCCDCYSEMMMEAKLE